MLHTWTRVASRLPWSDSPTGQDSTGAVEGQKRETAPKTEPANRNGGTSPAGAGKPKYSLNAVKLASLALCLLLFASALPVSTATAGAAEAAPLFTDVQFFGGSGRDAVKDVLPLANGNLLLVAGTQLGMDGEQQLASGDVLGWLTCLAPDGSIAWQKTYGTLPGANIMARPAQQADGSIALRDNHSINQVMGAVYRVTINSETGAEISRNGRPLVMNDADVLGENYWITDYETETYSLQNAAGEELWSTSFAQAGRQAEKPFLVEDGIVLTTRLGAPDFDHAGLVKLSHSGGPIWQTEVTEHVFSMFQRCIPTSDGSYLAVGLAREMLPDGDTAQNELAVMVGKDGNILWQQSYPAQNDHPTLYDVVETPEGYAALYTGKSDTEVGVLLMDKHGNELSRQTFRAEKEVYFSPHFVQWNGGTWVYAMVERKASSLDTLLMRLNMDTVYP